MEGYTEFFLNDGELIIHAEWYGDKATHYADYRLNAEDTEKLKMAENAADLVKELTKRYSMGTEIFKVLEKLGIKGTIIAKGFEDTSSDV